MWILALDLLAMNLHELLRKQLGLAIISFHHCRRRIRLWEDYAESFTCHSQTTQ
jgi:hypothetical protein